MPNKKGWFKRIVGPGLNSLIQRIRELCWAWRDLFCPIPGEYSMMLKNAMNFSHGCQVGGDYLEFGVFAGFTMTAAFHHANRLGVKDMRFFAFDSFQGLPEITGLDAAGPCHYHQGQYACGVAEFKKILARNRVDLNRVKTVEGWYDKVLNDETKKALGIQKAAVVWIDCDLYESTVPVLKFITEYVQTGTIICLDDFYCFKGDPDRGESKAFKEWLAANPWITAIEYRKFEAAGISYILNVTRGEGSPGALQESSAVQPQPQVRT